MLDNQVKQGIFNHFSSSLIGQVSLDVWLEDKPAIARVDQDECAHCDDVKNVSKEISNLHPNISLTYYDMEQHSSRASDEKIEHAPTTIVRGNARSIRFVGFWWGALFPAFLDTIITIGNGIPVLSPENQQLISQINEKVKIDLFLSPFENISTNQMIILSNIALMSNKVSLNIYEMSEFPILAKAKNISKIPSIDINGTRIEGGLEEEALCSHIQKIASGNKDIILKLDNPSMPYISEDEAKKMQGNNQPQSESSGIILPGQN